MQPDPLKRLREIASQQRLAEALGPERDWIIRQAVKRRYSSEVLAEAADLTEAEVSEIVDRDSGSAGKVRPWFAARWRDRSACATIRFGASGRRGSTWQHFHNARRRPP